MTALRTAWTGEWPAFGDDEDDGVADGSCGPIVSPVAARLVGVVWFVFELFFFVFVAWVGSVVGLVIG